MNALRRTSRALGVFAAALLCGAPAAAQSAAPTRRLVESGDWPAWSDVLRVVSLQDYNTRIVVVGVMMLGLAAGCVGAFLLLRKRALLGDALSHATLPGIGVAFIIASAMGATGKSLPVLLLGATAGGVFGMLTILAIVHFTRIREDAALGIVLSVFFGAGVAITSLIQSMQSGHAAGLSSFIYGKTASMLYGDALLLTCAAAAVAAICALLFKELSLLCFDAGYAAAQGFNVKLLDVVLMGLVVAVTVIGLQAVGLILMVAMLVIPPAAARFWTNHLPTLAVLSAVIGAASGLVGAAISALAPRMPAGALIVLAAGAAFLLSTLLGTSGGALPRLVQQAGLRRKIARQHLLRTLHELSETRSAGARPQPSGARVPIEAVRAARSWTPAAVRRELGRARRDGLLTWDSADPHVALTSAGVAEAARVVRNHRLWEMYLITHADIAPSHVDRDADEVEHVLSREMIASLEQLLGESGAAGALPESPHALVTSVAPQPNAGVRR